MTYLTSIQLVLGGTGILFEVAAIARIFRDRPRRFGELSQPLSNVPIDLNEAMSQPKLTRTAPPLPTDGEPEPVSTVDPAADCPATLGDPFTVNRKSRRNPAVRASLLAKTEKVNFAQSFSR